MKVAEISFFDWKDRFNDEESCCNYLKELKWQKGYICPRCGHDHSHYIATRQLYQCSTCQHQTSVTAGTFFHRSHLSLQKWFEEVYFVGSDKGIISAVRLSELIDVNWHTARLVLKKLRKAMGNKDSLYNLHGIVEVDDALLGGKRNGKRGHSSERKTPIIIACESNEKRAGFVAMKVVERINHTTVKSFVKKIYRKSKLFIPTYY